MSSRYTGMNCHLTVINIVSMVRWYVAGALLSPNSIRVNAYVSKCVVFVVFSLYSEAIRICQYLSCHPRYRRSARPFTVDALVHPGDRVHISDVIAFRRR